MLLAQLDLDGEPAEPILRSQRPEVEGAAGCDRRTPLQQMRELERCEPDEYRKVLMNKDLDYRIVGENYPQPMQLPERSALLRDLRTGRIKLVQYDTNERRNVYHSCATKGIVGDSDFTIASIPSGDAEIFNEVLFIALSDNVDFSIVYEGEWDRIWFKVWRRNIARALDAEKQILILTKEDGGVGFNQSIEVLYLRREGITFKTMRTASFVKQRRPLIYCSAEELAACLANTPRLLLSPLLEQTDYRGETALHLRSCSAGKRASVKLLLDKRANPNARDFMGLCALHGASQYGLPEIASMLIASRADVDMTTNTGLTPLHMACHFSLTLTEGHAKIVEVLLEHRADTNKLSSNTGSTPLALLRDCSSGRGRALGEQAIRARMEQMLQRVSLRKGAKVRVFGLSTSPNLNDQVGTCEQWLDETKHWRVLLGVGLRDFMPQNLKLVSPRASDRQVRVLC